MIYFIQARPSRAIKIGYTTKDITGRLSALQTGNHERLTLLAAVPGDLTAEKRLHRKFADLRLRPDGEWFRESFELLAEISRAVADGHAIGHTDTVARKLERRNGCRYGLRGLRMLNVRNGHQFTCLGTAWGPDRVLMLWHHREPETTRDEYAANAARSLGRDSPEFITEMDGYDNLGLICLAYVDTKQPPKSYPADDCMLLEDWPVACCEETTDKAIA